MTREAKDSSQAHGWDSARMPPSPDRKPVRALVGFAHKQAGPVKQGGTLAQHDGARSPLARVDRSLRLHSVASSAPFDDVVEVAPARAAGAMPCLG